MVLIGVVIFGWCWLGVLLGIRTLACLFTACEQLARFWFLFTVCGVGVVVGCRIVSVSIFMTSMLMPKAFVFGCVFVCDFA